MRVLFISNLFPDTSEPWRGLDNAALLHALKSQDPGLSVQTMALRPTLFGQSTKASARPQDEWTHPRFVPVPYIPKFGGANDRLAARAISKALRDHRIDPREFDILLTPWLFPDACAVHQVTALSRLPQLAIAQGSDVHRYLEMPVRRKAILRLAANVGGIVTRSRDLGTRLLNAGAPSDRVHPVYNGVDTGCFHGGSKPEARVALGLPADVPMVLFVGNFLPVKGIDLLLRAMARVCSRGIELHLAMIGSGPLHDELRSLTHELGVSDRVHWQGRRDPSSVAMHMRASDVVCLSSHNEGVPNVVLEAMASGRPIVSTHVGGIHEVLGPRPGMHGLVRSRSPEEYASALERILQRPPEESEIEAYGSTFSWANCARQHLQLMGNLLSSPTTAPGIVASS